jgi:hypothetical protein
VRNEYLIENDVDYCAVKTPPNAAIFALDESDYQLFVGPYAGRQVWVTYDYYCAETTGHTNIHVTFLIHDSPLKERCAVHLLLATCSALDKYFRTL